MKDDVWSRCYNCGGTNIPVVEMGKPLNYSTLVERFAVCGPCLKKAIVFFYKRENANREPSLSASGGNDVG